MDGGLSSGMVIWEGGLKPVMTIILPSIPILILRSSAILTWTLILTCLRYSSDLPSSDDLLSTSTWPRPRLDLDLVWMVV